MSFSELKGAAEPDLENQVDICFIGEPVLDVYVTLDHWPKLGDKACLLNQENLPGGTVANMAVDTSWLGLKTCMVGRLKTGEISEQLVADLSAHGVSANLIDMVPDAPEPLCYVFLTEGSNVAAYPDRSMEKLLLNPESLENISRSKVVCSTPEKLRRISNKDDFLRVIRKLKSSGGQLVLDIDTGAEFNPGNPLEQAANVIIMNEFGAERLFGMNWEQLSSRLPNQPLDVSTFFADSDITLIITGAEKGVWTYRGEWHLWKVTPATVVDPTGAGDAFIAGLVAGLAKNYSFERCISQALDCGARVVGVKGARLR